MLQEETTSSAGLTNSGRLPLSFDQIYLLSWKRTTFNRECIYNNINKMTFINTTIWYFIYKPIKYFYFSSYFGVWYSILFVYFYQGLQTVKPASKGTF